MRTATRMRVKNNGVNSAPVSGPPADRNVWIKVALSPAQARRLKQAAKTFLKPKAQQSGAAAWYLLNTALFHLPIMHALLKRDLKQASNIHHQLVDMELLWASENEALLEAKN